MSDTDLTPSARLTLGASIAVSVAYFIIRDNALSPVVEIGSKGASVGLLALFAALSGQWADRYLLVAGLTLAALGDMVLEVSLMAGGALFALAHLVMIALFLRHPRDRRSGSQQLAAGALVIGTPVIAALLTMPDPRWPFAAGYAALVGAMAASAWRSRFPRYRVGVGAVLFVISDLLIFAREGRDVSSDVSWWLIWPLYYLGQFLIATGVVRALRQARA